jgi:hypothetical protein
MKPTEVSTPPDTIETPMPENGLPGVESGMQVFTNLLTRTDEVTCTFSTDALDYEPKTNGTLTRADGKTRIDSTVIENNIPYTVSTLDDGTYTYIWGESTDGAFAMKMPRYDLATPPTDAEAPEQNFDMTQTVEYQCRTDAIDTSLLVPPSDIEFMDMGALMNNALSPEAMEAMMEQFGQ